MFENPTSINRIAGNITPHEEKTAILNVIERFNDHDIDPDLERPKTEKETMILRSVNDVTNEVLQKYGIEKYDVPEENIHIVDNTDAWTEIFDNGDDSEDFICVGFFSMEHQAIAIKDPDRFKYPDRPEGMNESQKSIFLKKCSMHEYFHFKSLNEMRKISLDPTSEDQNYRIEPFRCGLRTRTINGKKNGLTAFNEGITEELTIRTMKGLANTDFFTEMEKNEIKNYDPDEYLLERKMINYLTEHIYKKFPYEYGSEQDVFDFFAKSMLTGKSKELIKLVDDSFGRGTFQKIESEKTPRKKLSCVRNILDLID